MAEPGLALVVRTPEAVVVELEARSLRVPSDTGQVGLRPRAEPTVLAVEPGLVLARTDAGMRFVATAGGLLRCDGRRATLLTPVAVEGGEPEEVRAKLVDALAQPSVEQELRRAIERLEKGILRELRRGERDVPEALP